MSNMSSGDDPSDDPPSEGRRRRNWQSRINAPGGVVIQGDLHAGGAIELGQNSHLLTHQERLLRRLEYAFRRAREAQLGETLIQAETFAWLWKSQSPFMNWLSGPEKLFWVRGKPASGKSTLMNYVSKSPETKKLLNKLWNGRKYVTISFFFDWRRKKEIANSFKGLLLMLLYRLVQDVSDLAKAIKEKFPEWREIEQCYDWPLSELQRIIEYAVSSCEMPLAVFVDGLDEYDGDMIELARYLEQFVNLGRIKLCIASRPDQTFRRFFESYLRMDMQEYNLPGLTLFVSLTLRDARITSDSGWTGELQAVADSIAKKAEGVFLWARFAVKELVDLWYRDECDKDMLSQRLDDLPPSLEELWTRMFKRLTASQRKETILYLQLVCYNRQFWSLQPQPLFLIEYLVVLQCHRRSEIPRILQGVITHRMLEALERRIITISGGLIEIVADPFDRKALDKVGLIHRTVRTFMDRTGWAKLSDEPINHETLWLQIFTDLIVARHHRSLPKIRTYSSKDLSDMERSVEELRPWSILSETATTIIFDQARLLEQEKKVSSFPFIAPIMCEELFRLHSSSIGQRCMLCESIPPQHPRSVLAAAVRHGLRLYFEEASPRSVASDILDGVLFFAQQHAVENLAWHKVKSNDGLDIALLQSVLRRRPEIKDQHIITSIRSTSALALEVLLEHLPAAKLTVSYWGEYSAPVGLLWVVAREAIVDVEAKVDLLLRRGHDISAAWGLHGTPLDAVELRGFIHARNSDAWESASKAHVTEVFRKRGVTSAHGRLV